MTELEILIQNGVRNLQDGDFKNALSFITFVKFQYYYLRYTIIES